MIITTSTLRPASQKKGFVMHNDAIENFLILQGGGSLGAFGCGVFKDLANNNIKIDRLFPIKFNSTRLTRNEREKLVLKLAEQGKTTQDIAKEVHISLKDIGNIIHK